MHRAWWSILVLAAVPTIAALRPSQPPWAGPGGEGGRLLATGQALHPAGEAVAFGGRHGCGEGGLCLPVAERQPGGGRPEGGPADERDPGGRGAVGCRAVR